ncbi:hypothetical protein ACFFRR_006235 [Megaselia abdita]
MTSSVEKNEMTADDLPMGFNVKYVGNETSKGLWGIKYIRRPVDKLVGLAKSLPADQILPTCNLTVSTGGINIEIPDHQNMFFSTDCISYGVQDLVYTRVFAIIVVKDESTNPFEVHAFVCDSRQTARKLTFALAAAFQDYSQKLKDKDTSNDNISNERKKFAIDLRTPKEQQEELQDETEA